MRDYYRGGALHPNTTVRPMPIAYYILIDRRWRDAGMFTLTWNSYDVRPISDAWCGDDDDDFIWAITTSRWLNLIVWLRVVDTDADIR